MRQRLQKHCNACKAAAAPAGGGGRRRRQAAAALPRLTRCPPCSAASPGRWPPSCRPPLCAWSALEAGQWRGGSRGLRSASSAADALATPLHCAKAPEAGLGRLSRCWDCCAPAFALSRLAAGLGGLTLQRSRPTSICTTAGSASFVLGAGRFPTSPCARLQGRCSSAAGA